VFRPAPAPRARRTAPWCGVIAAELAQTGLFDLAILGVNLNGTMSFPVADIIIRRRIPLIFASGYALDNIPAAFGSAPKLQKPFQIHALAKALAKALAISSWSTPFEDPVPGCRTLQDAADHILKLPKATQQLPHWQTAVEMLIRAPEGSHG
jgi:hypothetical protein